jgi:hypothetical protein
VLLPRSPQSAVPHGKPLSLSLEISSPVQPGTVRGAGVSCVGGWSCIYIQFYGRIDPVLPPAMEGTVCKRKTGRTARRACWSRCGRPSAGATTATAPGRPTCSGFVDLSPQSPVLGPRLPGLGPRTCRPLRRAPLPVQLHLPARRLPSRGAGAARGGAGLCGARHHRRVLAGGRGEGARGGESGIEVRGPRSEARGLYESRPEGRSYRTNRAQAHCRFGAHPRLWTQARAAGDGSRRLRQPLRADHARAAARGEGKLSPDSRGSGGWGAGVFGALDSGTKFRPGQRGLAIATWRSLPR